MFSPSSLASAANEIVGLQGYQDQEYLEELNTENRSKIEALRDFDRLFYEYVEHSNPTQNTGNYKIKGAKGGATPASTSQYGKTYEIGTTEGFGAYSYQNIDASWFNDTWHWFGSYNRINEVLYIDSWSRWNLVIRGGMSNPLRIESSGLFCMSVLDYISGSNWLDGYKDANVSNTTRLSLVIEGITF